MKDKQQATDASTSFDKIQGALICQWLERRYPDHHFDADEFCAGLNGVPANIAREACRDLNENEPPPSPSSFRQMCERTRSQAKPVICDGEDCEIKIRAGLMFCSFHHKGQTTEKQRVISLAIKQHASEFVLYQLSYRVSVVDWLNPDMMRDIISRATKPHRHDHIFQTYCKLLGPNGIPMMQGWQYPDHFKRLITGEVL